MAKTIKFNLICDEKPVRTIEDLRESFSVEDVIAYYENGLLERWLDVRGYDKELEQVKAIDSEDRFDIAKELIKVFDIEEDEAAIEEGLQMMSYQRERELLCNQYEKAEEKANTIITDYFQGYEALVSEILEHPYEIGKVKAAVKEMLSSYTDIFRIDWRRLFFRLADSSYLAIMCMLMYELPREYYLPNAESVSADKYLDINVIPDKNEVYEKLKVLIVRDDFNKKMKDYLSIFSGETEGYWKDLEGKEKKYMVIKMGNGDYVRSAGETGGDFGFSDVNDKFLILQGIDYKSNSKIRELVYMEV